MSRLPVKRQAAGFGSGKTERRITIRRMMDSMHAHVQSGGVMCALPVSGDLPHPFLAISEEARALQSRARQEVDPAEYTC